MYLIQVFITFYGLFLCSYYYLSLHSLLPDIILPPFYNDLNMICFKKHYFLSYNTNILV